MHVISVVLVLLLLAPGHALASPWHVTAATAEPEGEPSSHASAAELFNRGSQAYEMGNYEDAVGLFERSYELSNRAELLFNLGQAYARWYEIDADVGHLRKSRKLYQNYISRMEGEDTLTPALQAEAQQRIEDVERQIDEHDRGTDQPAAAPTEGPEDKPVYKKGWFWGTIAAVLVVAGGVTAAVLLTRDKGDGFDPELGTLGMTRGPRPLGLRF